MAITLTQHQQQIALLLDRVSPIEMILSDAAGATLAEDLISDNLVPPYAVAAVDGYAVASQDVVGASPENPKILPVAQDISFDSRIARQHVPNSLAKITSGAPLPIGTDTVLPFSFTDKGQLQVQIFASLAAGINVRPAGSDIPAGQVLLAAGTRLYGPQIGLAAAIGKRRIKVFPVPRVVIVPVGDELVEPGSSRLGWEVAESSAHIVAVGVEQAGAKAFRVSPVADDPKVLAGAIEDQLVRADLVITLGGISGGDHDNVEQVLGQLGDFQVNELALRPGFRHGLGSVASFGGVRQVPVLALPGHPLAAAVAFETYVRPAIKVMAGQAAASEQVYAEVTQSWNSPAGIGEVIPVRVAGSVSQGLIATPVVTPGTISLTSLAHADGLILVDANLSQVRQGDKLPILLWK